MAMERPPLRRQNAAESFEHIPFSPSELSPTEIESTPTEIESTPPDPQANDRTAPQAQAPFWRSGQGATFHRSILCAYLSKTCSRTTWASMRRYSYRPCSRCFWESDITKWQMALQRGELHLYYDRLQAAS